MGEAKKREEEEQKRREEFEKLLNTPMTKQEADDALTRINVQVAQLGVMRMSALHQLNQIDMELAKAEYDKSVIYRRALVGQETNGEAK